MSQTSNNWKSLIGHRVLVEPSADSIHNAGPREFKVIEVSPSGAHVRFTRVPGNPFWVPHDEYVFVEDLGEDKP